MILHSNNSVGFGVQILFEQIRCMTLWVIQEQHGGHLACLCIFFLSLVAPVLLHKHYGGIMFAHLLIYHFPLVLGSNWALNPVLDKCSYLSTWMLLASRHHYLVRTYFLNFCTGINCNFFNQWKCLIIPDIPRRLSNEIQVSEVFWLCFIVTCPLLEEPTKRNSTSSFHSSKDVGEGLQGNKV